MIPMVGDSDRRPHRDATWAWWELKLFELADGFTGPQTFKSLFPVSGVYKDPQRLSVRDENRHYIICLPLDRVDSLRRLLEEEALAMFDQKVLYLNVGGHVEFVFPPNAPAVSGGYR